MRSKKKYSITIILVAGILVLLNIVFSKIFYRFDLTEDKRYTLSDVTKDILENIEDPITIKAYFSSKLPPDQDNTRKDFRDMLIEISQISKGMLVYEFIDPIEEEREEEAQKNGVAQLQFNIMEDDQAKAQKAFMGAVLEMGDRKEVIPYILSAEGMEYSLTSSLKKLSVINKPLVGILRGHGETGTSRIRMAMQQLEVLYQVEEVILTDSTSELQKFNTLAIIGPTDSIPGSHLQQLTRFVERGGNMLVAVNRVNVDLNQQYRVGEVINTGLESWLNKIGVDVNSNFVMDYNAGHIGAQMPGTPFTIPILLPYWPIIQTFGDHPVSNGLEQVDMMFVSSINYTGDSNVIYTPVLSSSELTSTQAGTAFLEIKEEWSKSEFQVGSLTVGAALEGPIMGTPAKMVIIGDADFAVPQNQQQQQGIPDNVSLFVNAIDWLSDDTGLIELRTQGATARPIDELEDGKRKFLKYFNFALPLLLAIGYGIFRHQRSRYLRSKRREIGYV
ncbi:MAG: Gldg family protein [Bacteroidales bacterium]|nr:Gldg family protein [Bacteroidales bacterium]